MKLCFSTLGCPDWNIGEIVNSAKKFNMSGVELRGHERQHISPEFSREERSQVKEIFMENSLEIACISAYTHFSMESLSERLKNEKILTDFVKLAKDLNCRYVRTFIGDIPCMDANRAYDYIAQSLNRLGKEIDNTGITVLIENHDQLCTGELLKPLLDRINYKCIGILWDMANSFQAGEALEETYVFFKKHIKHVHIKDIYKDESGNMVHCIPGNGVMPIKEFTELLLQYEYEGYFSLEWEKTWYPEMPSIERALPAYYELMQLP